MLALLAVPPLALGNAQGLWHGLALWLPLLALANRRRLALWLALPLLLTLPAVLYYECLFHMAPGISLWLILFGCTLREAYEYLGPYLLPALLWIAACLAVIAFAQRRLRGPLFKSGGARLACLALVALPIAGVTRHGAAQTDAFDAANQYFRNAYPWSAVAGYFQARREIEQHARDARQVDHSPIAVSHVGDDALRTVVLVIGESARRDRHHLYGYARPTTPRAEAAAGLLPFRDMVSLYPYTSDAVPVVLARYDRKAAHPRIGPNVVNLFRQAGYQTTWLSNQAAMGRDENLTGVYAEFAQRHWFARQISRYGKVPYDEELLPKLRDQLRTGQGDQFIVLHLFGSHEDAANRYPASFAHLDDAYDDSVAYTDRVLGEVIAELAARPGQSMLAYIADHGVKLGECDGRTEHFDLKQSYEVPFYLWLSPSWIAAHPRQYAQARAHLDAPLTSMNVLDTLADLADLRYPGFEPAASVLQPSLARAPRIVHTYRADVDYDRGANDAQCHLTGPAAAEKSEGATAAHLPPRLE